jgi:alkylation response protein AidB-like acyl-CoA dehydrogenase
VILHNVRGLYESDLILGEGSGFQVAQARLGPGRIHHCMRAIGMGTCMCVRDACVIAFMRFAAFTFFVMHVKYPFMIYITYAYEFNCCHERLQKNSQLDFLAFVSCSMYRSCWIFCSIQSLVGISINRLLLAAARSFELMLQRSTERKTFGRYLHEHGMTQAMIADSFADLQAARLLTLHCAAVMDDAATTNNSSNSSSNSSSNKEVRAQIAMIKATVPEMALRIVDRAIQVFGGAGVCNDYCLARFWAMLRTLRIADGPDAVHKRTVARLVIQKLKQQQQQQQFDKSRL